MAENRFGQVNVQVQTQQQTLSPQQVIVARLTELPLDGLRERIQKELLANQWLETQGNGSKHSSEAEKPASVDAPSANNDAYDESDDELPRASYQENKEGQREPSNQEQTFFDHLMNQMGEFDLNEQESEIVRYLIGSLEDDGMLRSPLSDIVDELDIYQNLATDESEVVRLLTQVIQQMEPAGVGARNLQECLILQVQRNCKGKAREQLLTLFQRYWDDFSHTRWNRIQTVLHLDDLQMDELRKRIRHLTPRPGGSVGADVASANRGITPDFFVHSDEEGRIHLSLNEVDLPQLMLSPDAEVSLSMPVVSKSEREAMKYLREQVSGAKMFIEAIAQRRRSMLLCIKAIVKHQRAFFLSGDEMTLKPMKLEDVAQQTGLDISTVSRVASSKYVQTEFGTYALRWFFTSAARKDGDEVSVRNILVALRSLVDNEDKKHPLSDERLVTELKNKGYAVARRTVAKYRVQLGIPESRMR